MAVPAFFNRVMETSQTVGTGTYTLDGASVGYQAWSVVGDGAIAPYAAVSINGAGVPDGDWEVGIGTYTLSGTTLARTSIQESSNANAAVDWPSGSTQQIFLTQPAAYAPGVVKIAEQSPTSTAVTFSSLGLFTHLRIIYMARSDQVATSTAINMTFNADGGANYDRQTMIAVNTTLSGTESVGGTSLFAGHAAGANAASNVAGSGEIVIYNYRGTTFYKSFTSMLYMSTAFATGGIQVRSHSGDWRNTAAITSVTLTLASGSYISGSKFSLYGVF